MKIDVSINIENHKFATKARCVVRFDDGLSVGMNSVHRDGREALRWAFDFAKAEMEEAA